MLDEVRSTTLKYCDIKEWGRGRTAGRGQEKQNTIFSWHLPAGINSRTGHSTTLDSQHPRFILQKNSRILQYLYSSPELIHFSTGLFLPKCCLTRITVITLAIWTRTFLEWHHGRTRTTLPANASPNQAIFLCIFQDIFKQHFHYHLSKINI